MRHLISRIKEGIKGKRMDNEAIARKFNRLADLMEIRGDDTFRIRSYRNAADMIETWPVEVEKIAREAGAKGLQEIPGVGKAISGKIVELTEKGTFDAWEKLTAETPETVLDLLQVGGVGRKTAAVLHQKFKIASLDDLKKFVAGGGLDLVDGIGEKSAERIMQSLEHM
ncbi:MAG TPA: helix-hairpin-helix domain-containing protein [Pyrinomonadaceae bacterium]|jgi:DNA polymerase (family 10)